MIHNPAARFLFLLAAIIPIGVPVMVNTGYAQARKTIVQYYREMPVSLAGGFKYRLENRKGEWISQSSAEYEIKPLVDIKNGYLSIVDHGTGGGTITHEVVLFLTNDGRTVIGMNLIEMDGVSISSNLKFYRVTGTHWKEVTSEVLPPLNIRNFIDSGYSTGDLDLLKDRLGLISIFYALPRYGTTAWAEPVMHRFRNVINNTAGLDGTIRAAGERLLKAANDRKIPLTWDMKKGVLLPPGK